ncbi:MAG: histidine kinase [Bacteroidetes bacterium]|nr:histidine kinase [Bacteroidota bacterium]
MPSHFANTYTIGDNNPQVDFNNQLLAPLKSGELLYISYNRNAAIIGNNYIDSIAGWSSIIDVAPNHLIYNSDSTEAWLIGNFGLGVLKNKKIERVYKFNWIDCYSTKSQLFKGFYLVNAVKNRISYFDGQKEIFKLQCPINEAEQQNMLCVDEIKGYIWHMCVTKDYILLSRYIEESNSFRLLKKIPYKSNGQALKYLLVKDENNFTCSANNFSTSLLYKNGKLQELPLAMNSVGLGAETNVTSGKLFPYYIKQTPLFSTIKSIDSLTNRFTTPCYIDKKINAYLYQPSQLLSFISGTENKPVRVFPYLQKYTHLYSNTHSKATFSLLQDEEGNIWAGSYTGAVSFIDKSKEKIVQHQTINFQPINGALHLNHKIYMIGEGEQGLKQLTLKNVNKVKGDSLTGFFLYQAPGKHTVYYGKCSKLGLWVTDAVKLDANTPNWYKIDSAKGMNLQNILSITEDRKGNIWCGHPHTGVAVYNPATGMAKTWLIDEGKSHVGAMSSLTDKWGTVWLGGEGLWYYNDYSKEPSPLNCIKIKHPLLDDVTPSIMSMTAYYGNENYLLLGCYDKICLLNLDSFYIAKKILVRYLNPQEAAFTSFTEQNTMFTSHTDSTIWFSTSDMVYNWNLKQWLQQPTYIITPSIKLTVTNNNSYFLNEGKCLELSPLNNSLSFEVRILSRDLLPRYMNAVLIKQGEKADFEKPFLQSNFRFNNLQSGNYIFCVRIIQLNGTVSYHYFRITIKKFLWQYWWFWLILSTIVIVAFSYLLFNRYKRKLAVQSLKLKESEYLTLKAEQDKKLTSLQITSLSSQFRPHFILNALNAIGAQMDDKPEAESVLSRLGESVNIIFNHAKEQKTLHAFKYEWRLVENIIQIHKSMYLKKLKAHLPDDTIIKKWQHILLPMGLLQIPVENALLHGLSNKETGPWNLSIQITEKEEDLVIFIVDNGIGRKRSLQLSNFTKHGTGTKNLNEIINIINLAGKWEISIDYTDDIYVEEGNGYGTMVAIVIPKEIKIEHE